MPKPKKNVIKKTPQAPTALIAGGAGFIGSHLAELLLLKDARVIVLDNYTSGKDVYISKLLKNPNFAFFDVDINKGIPKNIESVDYIFHLAGVETYLSNTGEVDLDSLLTNALGTKNLLDLAHTSEGKFLLASSTSVYQGLISSVNLEHYFGQTEEQEKRYSLAEAKRFAEALVWEYYKRNNTNVRIVRLPEVYGPRMNLNATANLGRLIKELVDEHKLTVYGEGTQKEYYLYIKDAISGLVKAQFSENTTGKIFTLVDEEPHAVLETAYLLKGMADTKIDVTFKPKLKYIDADRKIVLDKDTLNEIQWQQKTDYKTGITKTLEWLGYNINENSFKVAKLIEEKENSKSKNILAPVASIFSAAEAINPFNKKPEENIVSTNNNDLFNSFNTVTQNNQPSQEINSVVDIIKPKETTKTQVQEQVQTQNKTLSRNVKEHNDIQESTNALINSFSTKHQGETTSIAQDEVKILKTNEQNQHEFRKFTSNGKNDVIITKTPLKFFKLLALIMSIFIAFLTVFIGIPAVNAYNAANNAKTHLENYETQIMQLNIQEAGNSANSAYIELQKIQNNLGQLSFVAKPFGRQTQLENAQKFLESGIELTQALYNVSKATDPFVSIWNGIEKDEGVILSDTQVQDSERYLTAAKEKIQSAKGEFVQVEKNLIPHNYQQYYDKYSNGILVLESTLELASGLPTDLPQILGVNEQKNYLILLQNNNEIRPTGGFIGSYAVLQVKNAKIQNLIIDDIYNPDGQLDVKSINTPQPAPIEEFLEEERLHIRNANWNPDFEQTAKTIEDLFFKVDRSQFDGVFAIDLHVAKQLLDVTGPIYLTAYDEEITAENMYERLQFHSEFNYEPGSNQKKTILTTFGTKLIETILATPREEFPKLFNALKTSLDQKHILVYLPNVGFKATVAKNNWDGTIQKVPTDYLYVVNSNLGGTKANYFVENNMEYEIQSKTRDGLLRAELTLTYNHTGENEAWPGGPYTNYVRVLTQNGTKLNAVNLIDEEGNVTNILDQAVIDKVEGYNSFESSFILQPQRSVKLVYLYDLPTALAINSETQDYKLYWQKQPGTISDPYIFNFTTPFGTEITQVQPNNAAVQENNATFEGNLLKDAEFEIKFK